MEKEVVINGFISQLPRKFEVAQENAVLQGVIVEVDSQTGKARDIRRLRVPMEAD
jgi:calcineurin-like phosphoesterase